MSQEHLVSECLFDGLVKVKGLPWCKEKEKEVGIGKLTAPILCRHHNRVLGEADAGAKQTLTTLREASELWLRRKDVVTKSWSFKPHYTTDMLLSLVEDRLRGMSLTAVAKRYGVSRASVVRWVREARQTSPALSTSIQPIHGFSAEVAA